MLYKYYYIHFINHIIYEYISVLFIYKKNLIAWIDDSPNRVYTNCDLTYLIIN